MTSKKEKVSRIVELLDSVPVEDFVRACNQADAYIKIQPMSELSDEMKGFSPYELANIFFDSRDFMPCDEWFAFDRAAIASCGRCPACRPLSHGTRP